MTALLRYVKIFAQVNEMPMIDCNIKHKFRIYYFIFILEFNNTLFLRFQLRVEGKNTSLNTSRYYVKYRTFSDAGLYLIRAMVWLNVCRHADTHGTDRYVIGCSYSDIYVTGYSYSDRHVTGCIYTYKYVTGYIYTDRYVTGCS